MSDHDPFFAEVIEGLAGEPREISLLAFDQGDKALFELYCDGRVLASEEFSDAAVMTAIRLLMGAERLREGVDGTLPELARFMRQRTRVDVSLLQRLSIDFDTPMDYLVMMAWRARRPSADEFRQALSVLPEKSQEYLTTKTRAAIKHGEIKDKALIELVESLRQKPRPQPQPETREEEVPKKKRSLLHPRRK